jgi:hypothetical protein
MGTLYAVVVTCPGGVVATGPGVVVVIGPGGVVVTGPGGVVFIGPGGVVVTGPRGVAGVALAFFALRSDLRNALLVLPAELNSSICLVARSSSCSAVGVSVPVAAAEWVPGLRNGCSVPTSVGITCGPMMGVTP